MNKLLSYISLHKWKIFWLFTAIIAWLFYTIIAPLIVEWIKEWRSHRKLEKARKRVAGIATEEELRERVKSLPEEKKEKIESCFVPGIKELEAGRKLLQYGEEAKAKYRLKEAIKFFICAADALPCYETYYNLASTWDDLCDYDNAKENYQKAIQHDPTQPGGYNGLGAVYYRTSDYPKAKEHFRQALAKAKKLTDGQARLGWQVAALGNLGNVYYDTDQMEQAREHYQQALNISQEIGNELGKAQALTNLGNVYKDTRKDTSQMKQALAHYQQALIIFQKIGNKLGEAQTLNNLGLIYFQIGQMEQAFKLHQQSLIIFREIGNRLEEANALGNLGLVYATIGQMEQAREHYLLARVIFEQIGAPHLVKLVEENLAKLPGS